MDTGFNLALKSKGLIELISFARMRKMAGLVATGVN